MKQILQKTIYLFSIIFLMSFGKMNATNYSFQGPGTDWYTSSNWLGGVMPIAGFINMGDMLDINSPCVFYVIPLGNPIENFGIININSSLECGVGTPALLNTSGIINISSTGSISNSDIGNSQFGIINNNGNININSTTYHLWNYGTFNNNVGGTITNDGIFENTLFGIFDNFGTITNNSTILNDVNNTFTNSGIINNATTGTFTNEGTLNNQTLNGMFNNNGTVVNNNLGQIINSTSATFTNDFAADLINSANFVNSAILENNSVVSGTSSITNTGTLTGYNGVYNNIINTTSTSIINPGLLGGIGAYLTIDNVVGVQNFSGHTINLDIYSNTSYNGIVLTGNASLTGAIINITLDPAYVPNNGDAFTLIDASSFTTTSATINLPSITGFTWTVTNTSGNLVATLTANIALPISLEKFSAHNIILGNELNWVANNQSNFSHFEIEKSIEGLNFKQIGKVNLHDETTYSFNDKNINSQENFYRLKMVDIDGKFEYSKVVSVTNAISNEIIIVNNPIKVGAEIKIISTSDYMIYSIDGSRVNDIHSLSAGIYFVKNKEGKTAKFSIE